RVLRVVLRAVVQVAVRRGWLPYDLTVGIKRPPLANRDGYHPWTPPEIEKYRRHHPLGSIPRLAFEILYCTALRRGDAIVVWPRHVKDGFVTIQAQKTGLTAMFPILPELAEALARTPTGIEQWLIAPTTRRAFGNDQFGRSFERWCAEAGLSGCS